MPVMCLLLGRPCCDLQVPRAAQSASAFALGFFGHSSSSSGSGSGHHTQELYHPSQDHHHQPAAAARQQQSAQQQTSRQAASPAGRAVVSDTSCVGHWRPHSVALNMLPKRHDPILRFFDCCKAYQQHEDRALRWLVSAWPCGAALESAPAPPGPAWLHSAAAAATAAAAAGP